MAIFKNKKLTERKKPGIKLEDRLIDIYNTEPILISLDKIDSPKFHDRTYIDLESLEDLKENIKKYGLIEPIVVRKKGDRYERIAGFRRLIAIKKLYEETKDEKWSKIPSVVLDVDDDTAIAIMLSENIHREDLSDYDKVISILELINYKLGMNEGEVKKFLNKVINKQSGLVKGRITQEETKKLKQLEELLVYFKIKNWRTFRKMLALLNIPEYLKELMRKYRMPYYIVIELKKLKDENLIKEVVEKIKRENLTYEEVKSLVKQYLKKEEVKDDVFPYKSINNHLRKKWRYLPEEKKKQIDMLMRKIEEIISS